MEKSTIRRHLDLFYLVTSFWTFFLLGGLWSDYYQEWSFMKSLIVVDLIPAIVMILVGPSLIKRISKERTVFAGIVVAIYFIVPFTIYDYIYIYLYLDKSINYLVDYWYLTIFSIIPLFSFPITGYFMHKRRRNI